MVFAESMRLYPPAWAMGRQSTADVELQQWRLRFIPGQTVEVQPKITLRPKYPMMFVPEPC